jgi:hypothetical protein
MDRLIAGVASVATPISREGLVWTVRRQCAVFKLPQDQARSSVPSITVSEPLCGLGPNPSRAAAAAVTHMMCWSGYW